MVWLKKNTITVLPVITQFEEQMEGFEITFEKYKMFTIQKEKLNGIRKHDTYIWHGNK